MFSRFSSKQLVLVNRYYRITGFYVFLRNTLIRMGISLAILISLILFIEAYVWDVNDLLEKLVADYSTRSVFLVFLASESFLGLIPPEVFIAWASKSIMPWLFLFVLALLSYFGGIIAYFVGNQLNAIPKVKFYLENKAEKHINNLKKWGGFFVLLGAVSPIPHAIVSLAAGIIRYSLKSYLLWALFRFVRFVVYALIIFKIL